VEIYPKAVDSQEVTPSFVKGEFPIVANTTPGYATVQSGALFLGRRCCEILLPLSFRWNRISQQRKSQRRHLAEGMSTSLLHPPLLPSFATPVALPIFSRSSAVVLVSLSSEIKPLVEMSLAALEHLFFNVFDVGEPVPASDIAVFTVTLKLPNEFFR
jgi:hypothetical protein